MKTRYWLPALLIFILSGSQIFAQKGKADRLFTAYNYAKAIPYYEKLAAKNNSQATYAMSRLGDCYRLTSDFKSSAIWYEKAIAPGQAEPAVYFNYAQALRSLGRYDEAALQFAHYATLSPDDKRGNLYAGFSKEIRQWTLPEYIYELTNAEAINSPFADFSPVYYKDGLVFTSDRMAKSGEKRFGWTGAYYLDLFFAPVNKAEEGQVAVPGSPSLYAAAINQPYHDGPASFTSDFNTIYFTRVMRKTGELDSSRYYTNKLKIFSSTCSDNTWSNPLPFSLNNEAWSVGHPSLSADGQTMYFVSDMPGGLGGTDLYSVARQGEGWGPAKNLGTTINTFGNEMFPYIHNDSVLYFSSDGHAGLGSLDVFKSCLVSEAWSVPENLKSPVNSPADDFGIVISPSETTGMISSNRQGGKGEDDIYLLTIRERLPDSVLVAGLVRDRESLALLPGSTVFAWNTVSGDVTILKTDANGRYQLMVKPGTTFVIKGMKNGFSQDCLTLEIPADTKEPTLNSRDLLLGRYKIDQVFRLENIYYDFDKWNIRSDASTELEKVVAFLNENPGIIVELGSHTDARGSFKYNERLSDKRAESAVAYIISRGIGNGRITAKGYGEYQLVNQCADGVQCTDQEHQDNRRTVIKVTGVIEQDGAGVQEPLDIYRKGQVIGLKDLKSDFFNDCDDTKDVTSSL